MSVYRNLGLATSVALLALLSPSAAWAGQEPEPSTVELTTSEGNTFTATPDGDRYLVDTSVDPDGFIMNRDGSAVRTLDVPPAYVTATVDPPGIATRTVRVTNGCAVQQRVKVLVAFSNDSACLIVEPGQVATHAFNIMLEGVSDPRFDGLAAC